MDYDAIKDICKNIPPRQIKRSEIEKAINSINRGKLEDIFGLAIENNIFAGEKFLDLLHRIIKLFLKTS